VSFQSVSQRQINRVNSSTRRIIMAANMDDSKIAEQAMEEGKGASPVEGTTRTKTTARSSSSNKKLLLVVAGVLVAVTVIALSVGLGVGLSKDKRRNSNKSSNSAAVDNNNDNTDNNDGGGTSSLPPLPVPPVVVIEKVRISNPSKRSLDLISPESVTKTYLNCADASTDMRKMFLLMANKTILMHLESYYFDDELVFSPPIMYADGDTAVSAPAAPPTSQTTSSMAGGSGGRQSESVVTTESSFDTNNQVEGVAEADSVLSDGTSIFTAYGGEVREYLST
jgi:Beta propeller domain